MICESIDISFNARLSFCKGMALDSGGVVDGVTWNSSTAETAPLSLVKHSTTHPDVRIRVQADAAPGNPEKVNVLYAIVIIGTNERNRPLEQTYSANPRYSTGTELNSSDYGVTRINDFDVRTTRSLPMTAGVAIKSPSSCVVEIFSRLTGSSTVIAPS